MIDLFSPVNDLHTARSDFRLVCTKVNRRNSNFMVSGAPRNLFPIRTEARSATGNLEIHNLVPTRLDQENSVPQTHPSVDGGNDPTSIR